MADFLDDRHQITELDRSGALRSIEKLPDQIEHAWEEVQKVEVGYRAEEIQNIVVAGMGGSALGAHVIRSLAKDSLKRPLEIVKNYTLPEYVNDKTLIILSSYSGTTEETLASATDAKSRGAKMIVMTAGGPLLDFAKENQLPYYQIDPRENPSGQPRMAIGYMVMGQIGLLSKVGLLTIDAAKIAAAVNLLREHNAKLNPEAVFDNPAKILAREAKNRFLYLVSSDHLVGATHVMNNQINENAKHLTVELELPEINHHYLEALPNPDHAPSHVYWAFFNSKLYSPRNQTRILITEDVVKQNHFQCMQIDLESGDKFTETWELVQFGSYVSLYLAMLHEIDPAPIPWVDYFKTKLKES